MDIGIDVEGKKAVLTVSGKLTAQTSVDLEAAIGQIPPSVCDIDIDVSDVPYISSAGLRVFVIAQKLAAQRGGMLRLLHPCEPVADVLEMTGLSDVFAVEK